MLLGKDTDGITQISLNKLEDLCRAGYHLKEIRIYCENGTCEFEFQGGDHYEASGFGIGYGGEGPHGLWKAMLLFCPNKIPIDFWTTQIPHLNRNKDWRWSLEKGFEEL
jgi:hypothetical protein